MGSYMRLYISKEAQDARTPRAMLSMLNHLYFRGKRPWDPCPTNPTFDGLAVSWKPLNYANMPFAQAGKWLEKAQHEASRGRSSLLLLTARLNTAYLHRALGGATALHIWISRVTFPPFTQPLSHTVITVCYGERWTPPRTLDAGIMTVRRVPADMWDIGPKADRAALVRLGRRAFGDTLKSVSVTRLPVNGIVLTVLEKDFAANFASVVTHCRANPGVTVLLCTLTTFHSTYFKDATDLIRGIVIYRPRLHIAGVEMVASSQVLVMSSRPTVGFRRLGKMPPTYLVQTRVHTITDSPAQADRQAGRHAT